MIRKYHNHTQQINPRLREEEKIYSNNTYVLKSVIIFSSIILNMFYIQNNRLTETVLLSIYTKCLV